MQDEKLKTLKAVLLVLAVVLVGWFIKSRYIDKPTLITVTGEGKVKTTPTMVKFSVAVLNSADSAVRAMNDNTNLINSSLAILKGNGVSENEISLSYVRVIPPQVALGQSSYQAVNAIDVTLKNISKFDGLVKQLYGASVNSVSNIVFTTENSQDLEKEAVAEAIEEAKERAKELAKAAGKSLGRMVSIATSEVGEAGALVGKAGQSSAGFGALGGESSSLSQIEISRTASIVFELR